MARRNRRLPPESRGTTHRQWAPSWCEECRKRSFRSVEAAERMMRHIKDMGVARYPVRVYECPQGGFFHVTSHVYPPRWTLDDQ